MLEPTAAFALLLGFWALLYLVDSLLKTHPSTKSSYVSIMNYAGLSVHPAQMRWYTSGLNRTFVRLGTTRPRLLHAWFSVGVVFGCIAMVASQALLVLIVLNLLLPQPVEQQVLVPVMPGVNLPMSQIGYYLLTLFVCGVFHEMGHAVAAVREKVRVNGFGVFVLALYPGAFVDISTDQLQTATPLQQLRIFCAGVWHNFVIVVVAIIALFLLPTLLAPLYASGEAAFVTYIAENSAVSGQRGLSVADHVTGIDGCRVSGVPEWVSCIQQSMEKTQHGYCLPLEVLQQQDVSAWFHVSDYIPRTSWLPLNLFYILDTFCRYLVSLSGALALLNVVPCYALDGQWILLAFVELVSRRFAVSRQACSAVYTCLLLFGTLTLSANIVIALWILLVR